MTQTVVFDLDGVIRNLGIVFKRLKIPTPTNWFWKYQNKDIYDWIREDYNLLLYAKKTKFLAVIEKYCKDKPIEIWTHQPKDWQEYTKRWIKKNIPNKVVVRWLNTEQKYKKLQKRNNTWLVEDSPNFPNYKRIILIDRPYNKKAKAKIRVKTPKQLERILNSL